MTDGKPGSATTSGWFMALLLSALLAGCGGGGGGNPETTVSGNVFAGSPVSGGTVQMVCADSTPGTTVTTGADGAFTVTAPYNAPCVIRVSGGTIVGVGPLLSPLFSVFISGQTRANVNQVTTMLAFLLAGGNPDTLLFQSPGSISSKITPAAVATHKATINTDPEVIALRAAGGVLASFDFLETPFPANHLGFDLVLDKLGFTSVGNTTASLTFNGAPILTVNPTTGVASATPSVVISAATLAAAGPSGTAALATAKTITAYSFAAVAGAPTGTITGTATPFAIAVTVPNATPVTSLVATFTTTGASVMVGTTAQTSGTTANNFTSPVAYIVTAADSSTATYNVTVTVAAAPGPNLGTAASFAVLAGTTLTNNVTATVINTGNVGATGETISGTLTLSSGTNFPIGSETTYVTAKSDMAAAITAANDLGLFPCGVGATFNIIGAMGTASLAPGTYCINTGAAISGVVNLTLNAPGVYIFRTVGALTPAAGSTVVFGGTAANANTSVFWVVGVASLGSPGTTWKGTILTPGAVTMGDGTTLVNGRVLSNAAVILTNNSITIP